MMNKRIGHLLLISAVTLTGVIGANNKASAADNVDVPFSGVIPNQCSIANPTAGTLNRAPVNPGNLTANPSDAPNAQFGTVEVTCIGASTITVSKPVPMSADAAALANEPGASLNAAVFRPGDNRSVVAGTSNTGSGSGAISGNGTAQIYNVNANVAGSSMSTPVKPGTYSYTVNVAVMSN